MSKVWWFVGGFVITLALLAVGAVWAMHQLGLALPPTGLLAGAPTPTLADPAWGAAPTPTPEPPAGTDALLIWQSEGVVAGDCARLEIDAAHRAAYGPCDEGLRLAELTRAELDSLLFYAMRYKPFTYAVREETGTVAERAISLTFNGTGRETATPQRQAEIAAWALGVESRLSTAERHADLVAQGRAALAAQLGVDIEVVQPLAFRAVRWPDACLGLHEKGLFCAQVVTPGYQLTYLVGDRVYEYRADDYGQMRSTEGFVAPYLFPPLDD